jgi:hypothetical protein
MPISRDAAIRRRMALALGCIALVVLAVLMLAYTADRTPSVTRRFFGLWRMRYAIWAGGLFIVAGGMLGAAISRKVLLAFVTVGIATAGTLGLCELVGVTGLVSWPKLLTRRASELGTQPIRYLDVSGTTFEDTAPAWGLHSDPVAFRYRTDGHGFRNEIDRADADIYLLGDSVLVGALVPFQDTMVARLEKAVGRPVMQIALIGLGPQEEQQLFRSAKLDVRGRLVVQFVFEGNDLLDSRRFRSPRSQDSPESLGERTLTYQLLLVLQKLSEPVAGSAALRTCSIGNQTYTFLWARESFAGLEDEEAAISDALLSFAGEIRRAGGEYAVVFVPSKLRVLGPICRFPAGSDLSNYAYHLSPLRDYLRDWSTRNGIELLDLTEPLHAMARASRIPWFPGDTHWNAQGHAVAATALSAWQPVVTVKVRAN